MAQPSETESGSGEASSFTRRGLFAVGTAVLSGVAIAQTVVSFASVRGRAEPDPFMTLSVLLIPHRLSPAVGRRLATALRADVAPMSGHLAGLLALARSRNATSVEDFFPAASAAQQEAALKIISAWYLGVVDDSPEGQVLAYEFALMFQPVRDVMTIPTYAISGPNGWNAVGAPLAAMPKF